MKINPPAGVPLVNSQTAPDAYAQKTAGDFQKLVRQAREEQDDLKLRQACQEMEAIFIHQMLREMRATVPEGQFLPESSAAKIYRDMLDESYSKIIAESRGNLGLGEMLYRQLKQERDGSAAEAPQTNE